MIIGDFSKLMIRLPQDIRIEVLHKRYADNHQVAFIAHMRAEIAVQHAAAFQVVSGITVVKTTVQAVLVGGLIINGGWVESLQLNDPNLHPKASFHKTEIGSGGARKR